MSVPTQGDPGPPDWQIRLRGGALEARRRLRPVGESVRAALARIAPPISGGLLAVVRVPATGLLRVVEWLTAAGHWAWPRASSGSRAFAEVVTRRVTPVPTLALVAAAAAVALGVSQFIDYRGVAVGGPGYEGPLGTEAPAPLAEIASTGSAHGYLMLPLAAAALVAIALIAARRWRLGWVVGLIGLIGIALGLAVDVPKGLDEGTAGIAFAGAEAELLKGIWIQVSASAALALCGFLLVRHLRAAPRSEAPG
jgi:hypothetical protein